MGGTQTLERCVSGNLCVEESPRRLVGPDVWTLLRQFFAAGREFRSDHPVCNFCEVRDVAGKKTEH